ncbi:MAG: transposase [archaeon]
MKEKTNLIKKVKLLLKKAKAPVRLHHFGPKTYSLWQHVFALFIRAECRLSHRRTTSLLRKLGFVVASKSTLQRYTKKLSLPFWQKILSLTIKSVSKIVSIDGTGLEKTSASEHYIKRIDRESMFGKGYHFSIAVGENSQILSLRLRKKYCHDIKDVKYLFTHLPNKLNIILLDKGYDAEWMHKYFAQRRVRSIAPVRKNVKRGFHRLALKRDFPTKIYHERNRVESIFHSFKAKFGSSVSSRHIASARSDVYCKAILHNIFFILIRLLGQTLKIRNIYINF